MFRLVYRTAKKEHRQDDSDLGNAQKEQRVGIIKYCLRIFLYLILIVYGLGFFFFEAFIIVFSGGNL
jgi:hypothetical protein